MKIMIQSDNRNAHYYQRLAWANAFNSVPGYEAKYDELKSLGVDEIYCLSVNDAFVLLVPESLYFI